MIYRKFGKTGKILSALGIGTMRFNVATDADILYAVDIIKHAIGHGVNYIDTSYSYLGGKAEEIVGKALSGIAADVNVNVTVKVTHQNDKTADEAYNRVCMSLEKMGLKKASFFVVWSVKSYDEFLEIIKPKGLYDGAVRLKKEGLVDHICISLHTPLNDMLKIVETNMFEGITISYSLLNHLDMQPIINRAADFDIGIITMNSLAGGIIPQNKDIFSFIRQKNNESISKSALLYIYAHKQITTMLSGMTTLAELEENIEAVSIQEDAGRAAERISNINNGFSSLKYFCTGCRYCDECPQNINIPALLQSYNALLFVDYKPIYRRSNRRLLENIAICGKLSQGFGIIPESTKNPCTKCGKCEKKCTQSIPIMDRIQELYKRFTESAFSVRHIKERISSCLSQDYKIVAFYPGAAYTSITLDYVHKFLPELKAEIHIFDSNKNLWGTFNKGIVIENPSKLREIKPDAVIVSNYTYEDEIFNSLLYLQDQGTKIIKLHGPNDVPWGY
jgi:predicted aldo/keto reductase-like oxidoreductase